jgi:hypothetical protein
VDTDHFTAADDGLHASSGSFYETETFWFSFFVPERRIGAWLYAGVKREPGVTTGGLWMWDEVGADPWDLLFYEQFAHLKPPTAVSARRTEFPTGLTVDVLEPGVSYNLTYEDRNRVSVSLRFDALEEAVPLRAGVPPYPTASHYDQTGHVTGHVNLDGQRIAVDCHAMRDRSWGPRTERGYRRVGYTWAASPELSMLTFTMPDGDGPEHVYAGYVRRDGEVSRVVDGTREIRRDPVKAWAEAVALEVVDERGRTTRAEGEALSHMVLPHSTSVCVNSALRWDVEGREMHGEDQDVWPIHDWRVLRRADPRA